MPLHIEWEGEKPVHPPAEQVEDAVLAALQHPRDLTPLAKHVASLHLRQDAMRRKAEGVGYSSDGKPLVTFHYSLVEPWIFWCEAFDQPSTPQQ